MVSSEDTVSEQVVQARQTRRRGRRRVFGVRLVLAGTRECSEWLQQQAVTLSVTGGRTSELLYLTGTHAQTPSGRSTDGRHARLQEGLASGRAIPLARVWENSPG